MDYHVISADSHLEIGVDRWAHRVPKEHRDRAPRLVRLASGGDAWLIEGQPLKIVGLELCGGKSFEEFEPTGVSYDGCPGAGSPEQRLAEQDRDGVDAEVLFPGIGGANFWRGIANDASYLAVIRAYNEFLAQEYATVSPGRLVALGAIPETGIEDALAELRYCARAGLRGVCLNAWPAGRTYPAEEDDPFFREAIELGMALSVHVVLRHLGGAKRGQSLAYPKRPPPDMSIVGMDPLKRMTAWDQGGGLNAAQLLFAGTFDRISDLEIYFAENNLGWLPMFFEQLDMLYDRNIGWASRNFGMRKVDGRPSDYIKNHIYWGFLNNPFGVKVRHEIGVDRVMWASDFPHSESDWPHSRQVIDTIFAGVPAGEVRQMVCDNAARFFGLA
jgi:predicted TIM-barrel fold metal-dependent hydrolase